MSSCTSSLCHEAEKAETVMLNSISVITVIEKDTDDCCSPPEVFKTQQRPVAPEVVRECEALAWISKLQLQF